MLPIRGAYQIDTEVSPLVSGQFIPFQQTFTLPIAEHGSKYRNFVVLALILFAAGVGGCWVIGEQQDIQPGEIAPCRVQKLLSVAAIVAIVAMLAINLSEFIDPQPHHHADSHAADHHADHHAVGAETADRLQSQGLGLHLKAEPTATVGQPALLEVEVRDSSTGQSVTDVAIDLKVTQQEDGWTAFSYQGVPDATGRLSWQQQFFDGAPQEVRVELRPQARSPRQLQPFHVSQIIDVVGVEPPLFIRLISLLYLTLILFAGLGLGLWGRKQKGIPILSSGELERSAN